MLSMDQKDLFTLFRSLREEKTEEEIYEVFENYEINKLDIKRMYRYLEKHCLPDVINEDEDEDILSITSNL